MNIEKDEIIDKWDDTVKVINQAVDYFRTYYNIPASQLLPYDSLIVPFAYFFYKNKFKNPNSKQEKYLQEYFWKASLTYRFSSSTASRLKNDVDRIDEILKEIRPTYDFRPSLIKDDIKYRNFSTADSFCKAILCLLAKFEPKSFDNGGKVILDNTYLQRSNSRNYHHFFPKKFLKTMKKSNKNSIVNITFINQYLNIGKIKARPPSEYMLEFQKSNPDIIQTMKSHLIDNLDDYGVWDDDYDLFLDKRTERIFDEIMKRIDF